jgi:hypothetical protein
MCGLGPLGRQEFAMNNKIKSLFAGMAWTVLTVLMPSYSSKEGLTAAPAALAQSSVDISFFFGELEPHGSWVVHGEHDYVFVPAVERGWRPYVDGRWVWTDDYGWYWVSEEPFAWATYRYGRWGYEPAVGWFWVPGNVWAPAWVTWRRGGDYVGWAPMGPRGSGYAFGWIDYYEPPIIEAWVFVPQQRFIAVDLVSYVVPVTQVNTIYIETRETYHVQRRDGRVVNEFLPPEEVAQFVGTEIETYQVTEAADPAGAKAGDNTVAVFQPDIAETEPQERPADVVMDPEQLKQRPLLTETVEGESPADAPPSAAGLRPDDGERGEVPAAKAEKAEPGEKKQARPTRDEEAPSAKEAEKAEPDAKKEARPGRDAKTPSAEEAEAGKKPDAAAERPEKKDSDARKSVGKEEDAPSAQKEPERAKKQPKEAKRDAGPAKQKGAEREKKQPEAAKQKEAAPSKEDAGRPDREAGQQQQKGAERGGKADGESGQPDRQGGGGKPDRGAGLEKGGPSSQARGVAGGRGEQREQME